ncbi:MAG TPA: 1-deoxy-D-xylulose-5-phosphate reductoisomerase [Gammaproteobacteria bacterium]|nr:1-deoxy-D-xylulose-5-phosphate reductoisomerase [Gammaproteobacteria bacterium]
MKGVTILGATGSIGINTLDVMSRYPERYRIVALTANSEVERLYRQCQTFRPRYAVMGNELAAEQLATRLRDEVPEVEVLSGVEGLERVAALEEVDIVMAAIVGAAGLLPTLAAARSGKRILLANKEALVVAGPIFMEEVRRNGAHLLPIDSEHNAIFQCMPAGFERGLAEVGVQRIMLTSSGGPFLHLPAAEFASITPDQACAHPNWAMGRKISVDSATMMNKGLEVIEACLLFNTTPDKVQVVIHPQSVIHSMVEYLDGSVLAQLGTPDMRIPIAHALAWPERIESGAERLDLFEVARLDFEAPDLERFPCLAYAFEAASRDDTAAVIMNAANEEAVAAFLDNGILFPDIPRIIRKTLDELSPRRAASIEDVLAEDRRARELARESIKEIKSEYCQ